MAGPYGKLKADHLVWWDPTIDPNTGVAIGDVEKTLEDISDKATVANPEFTGNVKLTAQGELRLADSDSDKHVGFKSPAVVNNDVIWTLPAADGSVDGQMLTTNAAGVLSWSTTDLSDYALKTGTTFSGTVATVNHTDIDASITTLNTSLSGKADLTGANFTGDVDIAAGDKLTLGSDYEIYDTSTELRIESLTGHMRHKLPASQSVLIEGPTGSIAKFIEGGACELYHDNSAGPKIETKSTGVGITGDLDCPTGNITAGSVSNTGVTLTSWGQFTSHGQLNLVGGSGNTPGSMTMSTAGLHMQTGSPYVNRDVFKIGYSDIELYGNNVLSLTAAETGVTIPGTLTVNGNLTVGGTTTEVNSQTLTVDDHNIELGSVVQQTGQTATITSGQNTVTVASTEGYLVNALLTQTSATGSDGDFYNSTAVYIGAINSATEFTVVNTSGVAANHIGTGAITFTVGGASDLTADGGGIILKNGASDKTILWTNSGQKWTFNEKIEVTGNIQSTGSVLDSEGDVRTITESSSTTHILPADAGKFIPIQAGIEIDTNTAFTAGQAVTIYNDQGASSDETITVTGVTVYLATDPASSGAGPYTLTGRGLVTILCTAANTYVISGAGLS